MNTNKIQLNIAFTDAALWKTFLTKMGFIDIEGHYQGKARHKGVLFSPSIKDASYQLTWDNENDVFINMGQYQWKYHEKNLSLIGDYLCDSWSEYKVGNDIPKKKLLFHENRFKSLIELFSFYSLPSLVILLIGFFFFWILTINFLNDMKAVQGVLYENKNQYLFDSQLRPNLWDIYQPNSVLYAGFLISLFSSWPIGFSAICYCVLLRHIAILHRFSFLFLAIVGVFYWILYQKQGFYILDFLFLISYIFVCHISFTFLMKHQKQYFYNRQ